MQELDGQVAKQGAGTATVRIFRALALALLCGVALVVIFHQTTDEASAVAATPDDLKAVASTPDDLKAARGDFPVPDSFRVVSQMSFNEKKAKRNAKQNGRRLL